MNDGDATQQDFSDTGEMYSLDDLLTQKKKPADEFDAEDEFVFDDDVPRQKLRGKAIPVQDDELMCTKCFLVKHKSQVVEKSGMFVCLDCE